MTNKNISPKEFEQWLKTAWTGRLYMGYNVNPEDVEGVKEAITILENQNIAKKQSSEAGGVQIVTPHLFVDERNNHKIQALNETSPVYRGNRNYNESSRKTSVKRKSSEILNKSSEQQRKPEPQLQNSDFKLVTVNADINFSKQENSAENPNASSSENADRKHRRRMTLKNNPSSTEKIPNTQTSTKPTTTASSHVRKQVFHTTENSTKIRQEMLTDQLESADKISPIALNISSVPVKRFYRSSAETTSYKDDREMTMVNNEKIQIVRPSSMAKFVGEHPTPTATIQKLDAAVLGSSAPSLRVKKQTVVNLLRHENVRSQTNRYGT